MFARLVVVFVVFSAHNICLLHGLHTFGLSHIEPTPLLADDSKQGAAEKYHVYLEREFVKPFEGKCSRGVRIGYFDVAVNIELLEPKNMSSITPTNDSKIDTYYSIEQHNFWLIPYLNLCSNAKLEILMDEDIGATQNLCEVISIQHTVRTLQGFAELSPGYHVIRVLPVLSPEDDGAFANLFPGERLMGSMKKSWIWYGRHEYVSPNHKGATDHYNANPAELFDLATVQSNLGWHAASEATLAVANKIFSQISTYYRDIDHFDFLDPHWTYDKESALDPNFHSESPMVLPSDNGKDGGFLYFGYLPSGGLNNQVNELIQMIAIAHVLKRTLILPKLSLDKPSLYSGYSENCSLSRSLDTCTGEGVDFHTVFNLKQIKRNLGGFVSLQTREDYLRIRDEIWRHCTICSQYVPHSREAPLDWYRREFQNRYAGFPLLVIMRPNGLSHYPVKFFGRHALSIENRIRNALVYHDDLLSAAAHVVDELFALSGTQNSYMAIHQRVEDDWLEHSLHMDRLFGFHSEFWVSSTEVQARVDALSSLRQMRVVYLSVAEKNIDQTFRKTEYANLMNIWETHHIVRVFSNFSDPYGIQRRPYLLQSIVDYLICTSSAVFVGNGYSTFSQTVSKYHSKNSKPTFVYNGMKHDPGSQRVVKLRTDDGRLLEPFFASEMSPYASNPARNSSFWYEDTVADTTRLISPMKERSLRNLQQRWQPFRSQALSSEKSERRAFGIYLDPWPFFLEPVTMHNTITNEDHTFYVFLPSGYDSPSAESFCRRSVSIELRDQCMEGLRGETNAILQEGEKRQADLYIRRFGPTNEKIDFRLSLKDIGLEERNDKIEYHHYDDLYAPLFEPMRHNADLKILEIGNSPSSMSMWQRYFPHAKIYGIDLGLWKGCGLAEYQKRSKEHFGCIYSDRVQLFQGDVMDDSFLSEVLRVIGGPGSLDIIIDDGAHTPWHSITTFIKLFQMALKPGGLYSIEDIETNYWSDGGELYSNYIRTGRGSNKSIIEMFKGAIDAVNRHFFDKNFSAFHRDSEHAIGSLHFAHNVIVAKRRTGDSPFEDKTYRFSDYVRDYRRQKNS